MKKILKKIIGEQNIQKLRNLKELVINFLADFVHYYRYSTVMKADSISKKEAKIILDYHALEKGLLFRETKMRYGVKRVNRLHYYLQDKEILRNKNRSQIKVAYQVLCKYYEVQEKIGAEISDYFTPSQYWFYKDVLNKEYSSDFNAVIEYTREKYYEKKNENFKEFSYSRKSIRNFTGEEIPHEKIQKVVELASNAPSVCNRQASKVYLIKEKVVIDAVLQVQGGFSGYTEKVNQLLIITCDRQYFYTIGERNQFFIDGGMFLMNLLYSLHYFGIACCPANWGKTIKDEKKLDEFVNIPKSEKIICLVPIGVATSSFKVTLSKRRETEEILKIIE